MATETRRNGGISGAVRGGREEAAELGAEVAAIAADIRRLAGLELELAKAEATEQGSRAVRGLVLAASAAVVAVLTLVFLGLAAMFALDLALPLWASALIVGGVLAVMAGVAGYLAYDSFRRISVVPRRTVETIREDMAWAKGHLSSSGR